MRRSMTLALILAGVALAQSGPVNVDFQKGEVGQAPAGWFVPQMLRQAGYSAELRREGCRGAGPCAVVQTPEKPPEKTFGNLMQSFDAAPYRGRTVRLRAWLRLEAVNAGDRGQMWMRVDRPNRQMGFFDNMQDRPVKSAEWTRCEITGEIEDDAQTLNIGVMSIGRGRVWIDGMTFETVAPSSESAELRATFQKIYSGMDSDLAQGKVDNLAAMALPDAQVKGGIAASYRDALAEVRKRLAEGMKVRSKSTVSSVKVAGGDAIVSIGADLTTTSANGQHTYHSTSRDLWTQVAGAWKLKEVNELSNAEVVAPTEPRVARLVANELKQRAVPLATVRAGSPVEDLAAFGKAVGEARIVALGEATHGTREFFQMKHRLLEYLVKEKGFTVFAIEANWPESLAVDRYVKTGEGDPKQALAGMYFWTWNTQEVLDMIEWMRAYNKAPGEHPMLTFTSFDMQTAKVAMERVLEYLRQSSPADLGAAEEAYKPVREVESQRTQMYVSGADKAAERAAAVVKLLDAKQEASAGWRDARQAAEIVRQAAAMRVSGQGGAYRDEMMARNVEWLAREVHPKEKMVLWAHNGHVGFGGYGETRSMGSWLRAKFGQQMYVVGFSFHRGELRAVGRQNGRPTGLGNHVVPTTPEGIGDAVLDAAGLPLFFLDLRGVPGTTALGQWLAQPHRFLEVGALWMKDDIDSDLRVNTLATSYDGLIYVAEGHAAQGL